VGVEAVVLFHRHPRQLTSLPSKLVAEPRVLLLADEELLARSERLFTCSDSASGQLLRHLSSPLRLPDCLDKTSQQEGAFGQRGPDAAALSKSRGTLQRHDEAAECGTTTTAGGAMAQYMLLVYHQEVDPAEQAEREREMPLFVELHRSLREAGLLV